MLKMLSIYVILYSELDLFNTRCDMISYNKLWKLLIDRGMNKSDLRKLVGMSSGSLAKLGKKRTRFDGYYLNNLSEIKL